MPIASRCSARPPRNCSASNRSKGLPVTYDIAPPERRPKPGYYYHFTHDPNGLLNNYAYYNYGVGHHTEDDCRPEDAFMQVYRPLYDAYASRHGGMFDLRPLY